MACQVIRVALCATVFGLATSPLLVQAECETETVNTPVLVELPGCWSSEMRKLVTRSLGTELRAYGIRELSESAPDATISIGVAGQCTATSPNLALQVRNKDGESVGQFLRGDVDAVELPRVLALAIAELYAKRCAEPAAVVVPTIVRQPVTQKITAPSMVAPISSHESRVRTSFGAMVAAETLWYLSPGTSLQGIALGLHYERDGLAVWLGGALASGTIQHSLGSIDLQNTYGRLGLSMIVMERSQLTLRVSAYGELGFSRAEGRASQGGVLSDSIQGSVWALRAGPTLSIPLFPPLMGRLEVFGGHGGGVPISAGGEVIGSTSGSSLAATAGLALSF